MFVFPMLNGVDNGQNSTRGLNAEPDKSPTGPVMVDAKADSADNKSVRNIFIDLKKRESNERQSLNR